MGMPRWLKMSLLGCGGLIVLLAVFVVALGIVFGFQRGNQASQGGGGGGGDTSSQQTRAPKTKTANTAVEVNAGETAELRDRTLVINEVERNFVPNSRIAQQKAGYEFVRVYVTRTNTGSQSFDYNVNNFKVQDSNGVQNNYSGPAMQNIPYPISTGALAPGGTLEGNLVFEVPQGDTGLSLVYEPFERNLGTVTVHL
jgi:hypothetical protein